MNLRGILYYATLNRFFFFHFILSFVIIFIILIYLFFLHETGQKNSIGINRNFNKIPFNIYFTLKDAFGFIIFSIIFIFINLQYPFIFRDLDNFIEANTLIAPTHI
jgi:ubiquinol-cytochrome c reductase cytochrome b subunit